MGPTFEEKAGRICRRADMIPARLMYWHPSSSQTKAVPKHAIFSVNKGYFNDNLNTST